MLSRGCCATSSPGTLSYDVDRFIQSQCVNVQDRVTDSACIRVFCVVFLIPTHVRYSTVRIPSCGAISCWRPCNGHSFLRDPPETEPPGSDGAVGGLEFIFLRPFSACHITM